MGLDCEYPNSCDCGCQDEPRNTGCKCCGRETEHSDDCLIPENASLRAALQRAEAERDGFKQIHRHALDSVDQVFQACDEVPHPLLPDFCRVGEDKFRAVIRLANSYISERDRAEKYLEAMTEWIEIEDIDRQPRAHKDKTDDEYSAFLARMESRRISAVLAIRAIVEEASRG